MYQGENTECFVKLVDLSDVIVTGLTHVNMTVKTWNKGQTSLQTVSLLPTDVVEIGEGLYVIKIAKEQFPNVGLFYLEVSSAFGTPFKTFGQEYNVEPTPISFLQAPSVCVVTGNIMDITGQPTHNREEVSFRVSKLPVSVGGALVNSERSVVYPDAYGNFNIQLLRYAEVIVEIKRAGINYKFTVPNTATAPLLSLIPPI